MSDVQDWEENITPKLYSEYEFNVVFSHVIVKYGPTDNKPVEVHAYKEEKLKLVVDKPKKKYTKRVKPVVEEPVKDYGEGNWWIETNGTYHEVGWCGHNEFAREYLEKLYSDEEYEELKGFYAYEKLENLGWVRILGWKTPTCFVLPPKITVKQKQTLKEYCLKYKVSYSDYPEILKS